MGVGGATCGCRYGYGTLTCSNPLHLLLIEDDPTVAEVIVELLRARGHRVTHALHGLEALSGGDADTF